MLPGHHHYHHHHHYSMINPHYHNDYDHYRNYPDRPGDDHYSHDNDLGLRIM